MRVWKTVKRAVVCPWEPVYGPARCAKLLHFRLPKKEKQKLIKLPRAWRLEDSLPLWFLRSSAGQYKKSNCHAIKTHCCQSPIVNDAKLCVLFSLQTHTWCALIKITSACNGLTSAPSAFLWFSSIKSELILEIFLQSWRHSESFFFVISPGNSRPDAAR